MKYSDNGDRVIIMIAVVALVGLSAPPARAAGSIRIKQNLTATGVDPDAGGDVKVQIDRRKSGMRAKLDLKARRLDPGATYEVVLDGVRVGTLTTSRGGNGYARFSSQPRHRYQLLGTDPRGMQVELRDAAGDGVLETNMPDDTVDPTHVRCCLPHSGDENESPECEDRTPEACAAAGGVDLGAGSCLPNPCEAGTPPPPEEHIVCCTPEDHEPECETRSPAGCSEHHGVNLGAGTCDPNPCTAATPPTPETVRCCLADDHGTECEHRTPERCAAQGGTSMGAGACSPNLCVSPSPVDEVRCCLPKDSGGTECEQRTADQCAAHGGTNIGAGTCDANACGAAAPPGGATIRCCLPHDGNELEQAECEDRTPEQCAAQGGTDVGAGSCDPNPCG